MRILIVAVGVATQTMAVRWSVSRDAEEVGSGESVRGFLPFPQ